MSKMREPRIAKLTINMGVGEGGEAISKAESVVKELTNSKPVRTIAKTTVPGFGLRKAQQIGCKVTLRDAKAVEVLKKALGAADNVLNPKNFDNRGNFSFGVAEHIEIEGMKYDPKVGIFGMDVSVTMERPGYRVARRRKTPKKIPKEHVLTKEESIKYMQEKFGVTISE